MRWRGNRTNPLFLSTLSLRRATIAVPMADDPLKFLSTLSLRRATKPPLQLLAWSLISIHALLAESDSCPPARPFHCHAFLSTLSLRRATENACKRFAWTIHFYPRSPCGERQMFLPAVPPEILISIHALLAESDITATSSIRSKLDFYPRSPCGERPVSLFQLTTSKRFLSTLSLRRATAACAVAFKLGQLFLSTLSLRRATESQLHRQHPFSYFYPRSPCGERHWARPLTAPHRRFLSTLSLRRATLYCLNQTDCT